MCPPLPEGEKRGSSEALAREKAAEIARLAAEAARSLGCGDAGLEAAEAVIRAGMLQAGRRHAGAAAGRRSRLPRSPGACGNGHEAEFVAYRDKVIDTVLGPVTLRRAWYHCAACRHGFAPRDIELGVAGASLSPGLAAMNDKAAAAGPFAKAAGLLEDLAGVRLDVKRVERAAEASGAAQAAAVRERAALISSRKLVPLPPSPVPDMLYGAIDGTGVTMTAKETAGRQGKGEDGRARTREVKLGVFFTQDDVDEKGYPVRDRGLLQLHRHLRARRRVRRPGESRRHPPRRRSRPAAHHPRRRRRLDLEHRQQQVPGSNPDRGPVPRPRAPARPRPPAGIHARATARTNGSPPAWRTWTTATSTASAGQPGSSRSKAIKKDELDTALGYFENNAPRMRYRWFRQCGLFVGSGLVESGCKAVIGQRLKLSGMRWTAGGAGAIATLRCQQASRPEDRIWDPPHNQTPAA